MAELTLERVCAADLSVRSDGRTIYGIVAPYNVPATVNDGFGNYTEMFVRGAFDRTIRERADKVKLVVNHDKYGRLPIGVSQSFRNDAAGLYGEFRVSPTNDGNDTLTLIRDGAADSFSVGFVPVRPGLRDPVPRSGVVERTEVKLDHVAVVGFPAYDGARIGGVRSDFNLQTIWSELSPAEREAIRELDLFTLLREAAGNSATSSVIEPLEADDTEPSTEAASRASAGHSSTTQAQRRRDLLAERFRLIRGQLQ